MRVYLGKFYNSYGTERNLEYDPDREIVYYKDKEYSCLSMVKCCANDFHHRENVLFKSLYETILNLNKKAKRMCLKIRIIPKRRC